MWQYVNVTNNLILLYQIILLHIKTFETYFVGFMNNIANKNSTVKRTKQNRLIAVPDCAASSKKMSGFI